jgi:hypothetical protein
LALPPITGRPISPPAQPSRSVADARAAQKAFFDAALGKVQAPATTQRAAAVATPAAATHPSPILTSTPPAQPSPDRLMRPGSLMNIVV